MPDWKRLVRVHLKLPPIRDQRAERIVEEIAGQLDDLYQEALRAGASPRKAVRAAFAQIENWDELSARVIEAEGPNRVSATEQRREDARDRASAPRSGLLHRLFGGIGMDIRLGLRRLRAAPTSTGIAVGVLALAIGAGTAVFSVVDAVALRGLPFDEYDRLAAVLETDGKGRLSLTDGGNATPQTFFDWRRMQTVFDGLAAFHDSDLRMRNEFSEPATARGLRVSAEFFAVLRVAPLIGRPFRASDEVIGQHRVAILSYAFWQRRFGGAPDVVGRTMRFNDEPWQIVGVMPRHFTYPLGGIRQAVDYQLARSNETEVYIPLAPTDGERSRFRGVRGARMAGYAVIGRLRPGVSFAQAAERMNVLEAAIDAQNPTWRPGAQVQVRPLNEHVVGSVRAWMVLLLCAVGLVVALACANVANLRLAQAAIVSRDVAICAALGASRWRTTRAFLVENLLLAGSSATVGILLAWGGVQVLARNLPRELPRVAAVAIDLRVLGVAVLSALVTGLLVGLAPAALHLRPRLAEATSSGGSRATRGRGAKRIGNALVVGEVALASLLLVGAGLFVASFARLMRIDPGYDYRHVLALGITTRSATPQMTLKEQDAVQQRNRATIEQVSSAVRGLPGVLGAEAVDAGAPLSGVRFPWAIVLSGGDSVTQVFSRQNSADLADRHVVTPGYLALMRVPLLRGRYFSVDDRADTTRVVVINQEAARKYWPGRDALGQHIYGPDPGQDMKFVVDYTVVGIVGNIRHQGPEFPAPMQVYFPLAQWPHALAMTLAVRTAGDPMTVVRAVKQAIWSVNPEQRFDDTLTLEAFMDRLTAKRRFLMTLLTLFGVLGLVIAAAGVYAMLAHRVVERRREIGVRLALGATQQSVVQMVLRQALVLLGVGLAIGLGTAWQFGAGVKAFLFGTEPADPLVFAVTLVGLAIAGVVAAVGPARRAARVDPIVTLRCE